MFLFSFRTGKSAQEPGEKLL